MGINIEKKEIRYLLFGVIGLIIFFIFLRPSIGNSLRNMSPILAMIIFNLALLFYIGILSSLLNHNRVKISFILLSVFLGLSTISGPYLVSPSGELNSNVDFYFISPDYAFGTLWLSLGIPKNLLFIFVYIITPLIFLFLLPVVITNPRKLREVIS